MEETEKLRLENEMLRAALDEAMEALERTSREMREIQRVMAVWARVERRREDWREREGDRA